MRLAIFGGTFDPIHNAHLAVAREAAARFELDRVWFIPAENPPHKHGVTHAPYADRLRMVELACRGEPRFEASRLEEGTTSSYSIDTIEKVRADARAGRRVVLFDRRGCLRGDRELASLAGGGCSGGIHRSKPPRPSLPGAPGATVHRLETVDLPVSSSEIRRKLAAGDEGVDVPSAVLDYIRARGLYRAARTAC